MSRNAARSKASHERWLVSYADFITLLFAFFVVLYAFAKADERKYGAVSAAIDSGFQAMSVAPHKPASESNGLVVRTPSSAIPESPVEEPASQAQIRSDLERIKSDLRRRLSTQIAERTVSIQLGRDGLVISLREAGFFDSGAAIPRAETEPSLQQIADSLRGTPYDVRVEGHTDNVPMHSAEFDSNWELSSARATRIARLFLEMHAIRPEQLSASGYAEFHPVATNGTPEGRAENRRVDLVVMPRAVLDLSTPDRSNWRKITDQ